MVCRLLLGYGAWRSLASASALGAEGRRFESCRPDQKRRVFLGNEKGFFVSTRGAWARTCEQAGLTECFQERTFRSENTKKVKQSCRPDQKRRVFLGNEKGFFVSTWGDWARTCEQAGLTECFRDGRSARKIRRRRSNPVAPTKYNVLKLLLIISLGSFLCPCELLHIPTRWAVLGRYCVRKPAQYQAAWSRCFQPPATK
jgi:hypothetical protein